MSKPAHSFPQGRGETAFRLGAVISASIVPLILIALLITLVVSSKLSLQKFGFGFLVSTEWNPVTENFGALSAIYGTVVSTIIAMLLALPFGLIIALFLVEHAPPSISGILGGAIELLAAIPSIVYGMWGLFVFAPFMSNYIQPFLGDYLGFLPLFQGPPMGIGMLTAGLILALMILPYISSVSRDVFRMVPEVTKESAYGLGATNWEVTRGVTLRYSLQGIVGAAFLGLGRALGETMAITFVIGNNHHISASLFEAGNSIASTLANEFTEASESVYLSSLIELGLILLIMTVIFQAASQLWLKKIKTQLEGKA